MAEFYSARGWEIPPLPWTNLSPPFSTLRDLARWLYRQLRSEYEHQTSDAVVDEAIAINELTFTAEGRRFG